MSQRSSSVIPGFGLTLGFSLSYLGLIVLIPLAGMFLYASQLTLAQFWELITSRQVLFSLQLSFGTALAAAFINGILGTLLAWVLVRYTFPGRKVIDAMIDMPFALPTAVAGIALTALYAPNGLIGSLFPFKIAYTGIGITLALILSPCLLSSGHCSPFLPIFEGNRGSRGLSWRASAAGIPPCVDSHLASRLADRLCPGVCPRRGEYGSVVFIAGNIPFKTEILPLLIVSKLDQYDYKGATGIGVFMLLVSFIMLLLINLLQRRIQPKL